MTPRRISRRPYGCPPTFPMGIEKTRNLELAQAQGKPLVGTCPLHSYPAPDDAVWEFDEVQGVWIVTFYPCEHRGYPQWPIASHLLREPVAHAPRRPWWRRLMDTK